MEESFIVISFVVSEKKSGAKNAPSMPKYRKNTTYEIGLKAEKLVVVLASDPNLFQSIALKNEKLFCPKDFFVQRIQFGIASFPDAFIRDPSK